MRPPGAGSGFRCSELRRCFLRVLRGAGGRDEQPVSQLGLERRPAVTYHPHCGAWPPESGAATWGRAAPSR